MTKPVATSPTTMPMTVEIWTDRRRPLGSAAPGGASGAVTSSEPGSYEYSRPGEIVRCPWHGWEFDVRTGRSWCDPKRMRLMNYAVTVEPGAKLVEGPYVAETFAVAEEDDYVVVETK